MQQDSEIEITNYKLQNTKYKFKTFYALLRRVLRRRSSDSR